MLAAEKLDKTFLFIVYEELPVIFIDMMLHL